jgi:hypothetical protein
MTKNNVFLIFLSFLLLISATDKKKNISNCLSTSVYIYKHKQLGNFSERQNRIMSINFKSNDLVSNSKFKINSDSLLRFYQKEIESYENALKRNNRERLSSNTVSIILQEFRHSPYSTENEVWQNMFTACQVGLTNNYNKYSELYKNISSNKYLSGKLSLDTFIGLSILNTYNSLLEIEKNWDRDIKNVPLLYKSQLCVVFIENDLVFKELRKNEVQFGLAISQMEVNSYLKEKEKEDERDKNRIAEEKKSIEDAELRHKEEKEKELAYKSEHTEWLKTANYTYKISVNVEKVTKECRFCYKVCTVEKKNIAKKPDFSNLNDLNKRHLEDEYIYFIWDFLGSQYICGNSGCKESKSGEHALKIIQTNTKVEVWDFKVNKNSTYVR